MKHRASAALLKRIGEELIKDPQTAFFELVKNGYDADATRVEVEFRRTSNGNGRIIIRDDGTGMSEDDVRNKWFRPGSENKVREPYTTGFRRRRLGAKGIGRYSLAKLGDYVKVVTRERERPAQLNFKVDFSEFTDEKDLEEIDIDVKSGPPRKGFLYGTILEIGDLKNRWGKREIRRIREQLSLLIDPEEADQSFKITLDASAWPDLSGPLENPLAGQESHRLAFSIDASGGYESELTKAGELVDRRRESRTPLEAGPVRGVLRYFKEGVKVRQRQVGGSKDETHMGVKVYRDSCRVRPYGEPADDWLGLKAMRSRKGGKFPVQAHLLAGSVYISATHNPGLRDESSREGGMIGNDEFEEFSNFVGEQIEILNQHLQQETRSEAQKKKRQTVEKILNTVVRCLNEETSDVYRRNVDRLNRSRSGQSGESRQSSSQVVTDVKPPTKDGWQCNDCGERWRVLRGCEPLVCAEGAVNRKGEPRRVEGCGSANIERAKHRPREQRTDLSSIVAGEYALVGGSMLRVRVDYDMGLNDDEFVVGDREIVINGNHPAYGVAERLDGISGSKYQIGDDVFVPALTVHISKCSCLAWGEIHYGETENWADFKSRYEELQARICAKVAEDLG